MTEIIINILFKQLLLGPVLIFFGFLAICAWDMHTDVQDDIQRKKDK